MRVHYPRTPHVPWSPGASSDDVRAGGLSGLAGREVVVTEKLDGENTSIYRDGLHARSLDSAHHPSRTWVKGLQGRIGPSIPAGWRVCGENMQARHSLTYSELESWFYGFSVWDGERCLDWDATVRFLRARGVPTPPVLWRGIFDERALRGLRLDLARQEGYVVRTVAGFSLGEFGSRVAKWVRSGHVQTDTHWMHAEVVENGLGPRAVLWDVRSGAWTGSAAEISALLTAVGIEEIEERVAEPNLHASVAEVLSRLGTLGRGGDARLAGVLAALLHRDRRTTVMTRLAGPLGLPLARRIGDLIGLHARLYQPLPDDDRRAGLTRMADAADLGVLHAVAHAALAGAPDGVPEAAGSAAAGSAAREQVEWSELHADEAGLLGPAPFGALARGLRDALLGEAGLDPVAADRCWAQAREAYALGRLSAPDAVAEAVAATWTWRSGEFPRLIQPVGPSGSGKSSFIAALTGVDAVISMDELRAARGSRADQQANPEVLHEGLRRLEAALGQGKTVVWDATSLNRQQRALVHKVAARRDALLTYAVMLVDEDDLLKRNAAREHAVPPDVLSTQIRRYAPPYPGDAHRTWYIGASGRIEDRAGELSADAAEATV